MQIEKVKKLVRLKRTCYTHTTFKRSNKLWINIEKGAKVIKFNQKIWLKPYNYLNTKTRKNGKYDFKKSFLKLMNNAIFEKNMKNVRKYRNTKPVTTEARRNYLISEPNRYTTIFFLHKTY